MGPALAFALFQAVSPPPAPTDEALRRMVSSMPSVRLFAGKLLGVGVAGLSARPSPGS